MTDEIQTPESAPVITQTQTMPMAAKPPRKKRTGCVVVSVILILMLCCCGSVMAVGGWTLFSIYSGVSNPKPEDLGVKYTQADVGKISQKTGITIDTKYGQPNTGTVMKYEGTKEVDTVLTQAEVSAYTNYVNSPNIPIKDVQIKIKDNSAVSSMLVIYNGKNYPITISFTGTIIGNTASGNITSIKIKGLLINIPEQYRKLATEYVVDLLNSRLSRVTGLNITTFKFKNGRLILKGTFPAKAWRAQELVK